MQSSSWRLSEGSRLNFELQLSSKCVQSISLHVIWECWIRLYKQTLFLSWLWVLECDRAPLFTCWCTGRQIQNLLALRWSDQQWRQNLVSTDSEWPVTPELGLSAVQPTPAWQRERLGGLGSRSWPIRPKSESSSLWSTTDECFQASEELNSWLMFCCCLTCTKMFYLTARLLNLHLRFHWASPGMGEEHGDAKYLLPSLFSDSQFCNIFNVLLSSDSMSFHLTCLFRCNQFIYPLPLAITTSFSSPGWWFMMCMRYHRRDS